LLLNEYFFSIGFYPMLRIVVAPSGLVGSFMRLLALARLKALRIFAA
jgi:hypothetical protein